MGKMKTSQYFTGKDEEYYNGDSIASKRRRSFELMYNPQNHMRRRELTEVLDMHRCHGCGLRFGTISLLERHIRVCKHKEKIKEMHSVKTTVTSRRIHKRPKDAFVQDAHKQKCRYCDKLFTYIGMLKKHILDICPVRKEYFEHGNEDHIDKEWEETIMCVGGGLMANCSSNGMNVKESSTLDNMSDISEDSKAGRKRKGRGRRKNRKWGNQNKNRKKSPDNVKNTNGSLDDVQTPPKSPESSINTNSIQDEEGDSDDTECSTNCEMLPRQDECKWPDEKAEAIAEVTEMTADAIVSDIKNGLNDTSTLEETSQCQENEIDSERIVEMDSKESKVTLEMCKEKEGNRPKSPVIIGREIKEIDETEHRHNSEDAIANDNSKNLPLDLKADDAHLNIPTASKLLFDLDSTIARLKERTNEINKEEKEVAQTNCESDTSVDKIPTNLKVGKNTTILELDISPTLKKAKKGKKINSAKNVQKKFQMEKERNIEDNKNRSRSVTPENISNGDFTTTKSSKSDASREDQVVKPVVKRGRKPKNSYIKSLEGEKVEKINTNYSDNTLPTDERVIEETEIFDEKSAKVAKTKILKGKGGRKSESNRVRAEPIVANQIEDEDTKKNGSPKKLRKVGKKKVNNETNSQTNEEVSDQSNQKESNEDAKDIENGILDGIIPVKSKRNIKKRKIAELSGVSPVESADNIVSMKGKKSSRIKEQQKAVENGPISNNDESKTSPSKRKSRSTMKEVSNPANGLEKVSLKSKNTENNIKGRPQKRNPTKTNDLLVPDKTMRASSRSTSRSTSRSRSRSVQRELTPTPPTKKPKLVPSVKNTKKPAQGSGKQPPNQKKNEKMTKQSKVTTNSIATGNKKSVTASTKAAPGTGRGRPKNKK